jgi:hypothetical protein
MRVPYKGIAAKVGLSEMSVMLWFSWHRDTTRAKFQLMPKTMDANISELRPDDRVKKLGMTLYEVVAAIEVTKCSLQITISLY